VRYGAARRFDDTDQVVEAPSNLRLQAPTSS
jgi:hypothetical protein